MEQEDQNWKERPGNLLFFKNLAWVISLVSALTLWWIRQGPIPAFVGIVAVGAGAGGALFYLIKKTRLLRRQEYAAAVAARDMINPV